MNFGETLLSRLGTWPRLAVPHFVLFVLFLLNLLLIPIPFVDQVHPYFVLIAVYYWSIYRPTLMPPALCFAVGLCMDILSGGTLGVQALILVLVQWIVRSQRRFLMGQPYIVLWFLFALVTIGVVLLQWLLWAIALQQWPPLGRGLIDGVVTFLLFPFISLLLIMVHRMLPLSKDTA